MNCSDAPTPQAPKKTVSVCIASAGPTIGLWATIAACEQVGLKDVHVVFSGSPLQDSHYVMSSLGIDLIYHEELLIPPVARNLAAAQANGDYFLFLDDHVLPGHNIEQSILALDAPVYHCAYQPSVGNVQRYYHFEGSVSMVEGDYVRAPKQWTPYKIGSFTASTLCVKREVWRDVGGYPDWYEGFGGEEASFDLMCWSKGYEVWSDPNSCAYHYSARAAARGYEKVINKANYARALKELEPHLPRLKEQFIAEGIPF
jgi:hypothetical protein